MKWNGKKISHSNHVAASQYVKPHMRTLASDLLTVPKSKQLFFSWPSATTTTLFFPEIHNFLSNFINVFRPHSIILVFGKNQQFSPQSRCLINHLNSQYVLNITQQSAIRSEINTRPVKLLKLKYTYIFWKFNLRIAVD